MGVAINGRFVQHDMNQLQNGTTKSPLVAGQCAQFQFEPREVRRESCTAAGHAPRIRPRAGGAIKPASLVDLQHPACAAYNAHLAEHRLRGGGHSLKPRRGLLGF